MSVYDRPPGSSRCPHTRGYIIKKVNARATLLICVSCRYIAGWWTDSQDNTNYETIISGPVTELSEKELEALR